MTCSAPSAPVEVLDQSIFMDRPDEWQELLEQSYDNRIFLTPTWFQTWWQYFEKQPATILSSSDESGQIQAVLPLQLDDEGTVTLLGSYSVADYMDGLAKKASAKQLLEGLWTHALDELPWERVDLRHVPAASPLIPALKDAAERRSLTVHVSDDEVCPIALLCNDWDGYLQMLSKKQRHEIRRKLRRAQEGSDWEWRTATSEEDIERDLPVFFRLHELSGREKARFMTADMRAFFCSIAKAFCRQGILRLSVYRRNGVDIAATMSFLYRGRFLLYNSGYDPAYAIHSPGIAAVSLAMQDAINERAVAFDFLSGNEPYKYQFGASDTHTCRVSVNKSPKP